MKKILFNVTYVGVGRHVVTRSELEKLVTVMQVPFPALTYLEINLDGDAPVIPAGF